MNTPTRRTVLALAVAWSGLTPNQRAMAASTYQPSAELLAAARKEGRVILYTTAYNEVEQEVINLFNKSFPFIKVEMVAESVGASSKHGLLATLHHTFPMCSGDKAVQTMDLKPGDCLHTVTGKGIVDRAPRLCPQTDRYARS